MFYKFNVLVFIMGVLTGAKALSIENLDLSLLKQQGNANWQLTSNDEMTANDGSGFLVTRQAYQDFKLTLEFYAKKGTNSGVFFKCEDVDDISDKTCYEANIFDSRPDQTFRTGALTGYAPPKVQINAENGKWNKYEILAVGNTIRVTLNGLETVFHRDNTHTSGRIAFQYASGEIRFRNISIVQVDPAMTKDISGVWELTKFELDDGEGTVKPWCERSHGVIIYTDGYMSVAINCSSNPQKMVHYSGPYQVENGNVVHNVKNYSSEKLLQLFVRELSIYDNKERLDLIGPFGENGKAIVSWKKR